MDIKEQLLGLLKKDPNQFVEYALGLSDNERKKLLHREYSEIDRTIRDTQVGKVQKVKWVGKGNNKKRVDPVRTPITYQQKIVESAASFEVGAPVSIVSDSKDSVLADEIDRLWKKNRIDSLIQDGVVQRKSQLESAILFYIQNISKNESFNRIKGVNDKKEIKCRILDNSKGIMTPFFDMEGDMVLFSWRFNWKNFKGQDEYHIWVYDDTYIYKYSKNKEQQKYISEDKVEHGFDRIPVAYTSQENQEWYKVRKLIDRLEVSLSKLGGSNDYAGHPILALYGEVKGLPDKDVDGKALRITQKESANGQMVQGDAKFLTYKDAPQSVEIELKKLEKYIESMSSTVDITFDSFKGLGSISGYAIELMFMDALMKAQSNNLKYNQAFIERCINIMISGIVTTLDVSLVPEAEEVIFDVKFNSILPKDLDRAVQTYMNGVNSGFISTETAVKNIDVAHDVEKEIETLNSVKESERQKQRESFNQNPLTS